MSSYDVSALSQETIYKLLIGAVIPRPIGWVSCASAAGVRNIAPFSYFNAVSSYPPMLGFSVAPPKFPGKTEKDTLNFIRETGVFVVNIPSADLLDKLALTSLEVAREEDEFDIAGLTAVDGVAVKAPRIAEAPVSFECELHTAVDLGGSVWIIGAVVHIHVRDGLLDERFRMNVEKLRPLGRMPGPTYCTELNVVTRAVERVDAPPGMPPVLSWLPDPEGYLQRPRNRVRPPRVAPGAD